MKSSKVGMSSSGPSSEFEEGRILGHAQEQRRLEIYLHDRLAPDLVALAFSIESIRAQLEAENHPAEPKLREVQHRLSEIMVPIRQEILGKIRRGRAELKRQQLPSKS